MSADLAALAPPLIILIAIVVTVVLVLRHQMAPPGDSGDKPSGHSADHQ